MFDALIKKTKLYRDLEKRNQLLEGLLKESNCILGYMLSEPHVLHKDDVRKGVYTYITTKELEKYRGYVPKKTMIGFPEAVYKVWAEREKK